MDIPSPEAPTPALAGLIAAGLVSHEMSGDPGRLENESAALRALCALVAGPVYRVKPWRYAFRVGEGDMDGALDGLASGLWADTIEAALAARLGTDAVQVTALDAAADAPAGEADAALGASIAFLRIQDEAVTAVLRAAEPGLRAIIDAGYAAETARRTASGDPAGPIAARIAGLEARLSAVTEALEAQAAQSTRLAAQLTDGLAALAAQPAAFEERLGLTIAEFLARLERAGIGAEEAAPARGQATAPQGY